MSFQKGRQIFIFQNRLIIRQKFCIVGNVFGLGEGGDFHHKCSYEERMFD